MDEGTAMFKAASTLQDTPAEGQFVYMSVDGPEVPEDFYLSLAGNFTSRWRAHNKSSLEVVDAGHAAPWSSAQRAHSYRLAQELTQSKLAARQHLLRARGV
eukprot:COSAG01_NODE_9283_length_2495_cov_1.633973_3_plen_101_part_00